MRAATCRPNPNLTRGDLYLSVRRQKLMNMLVAALSNPAKSLIFSAVGFRLAVTVRTKEAEIFTRIVIMITVHMVQMQRQVLGSPL